MSQPHKGHVEGSREASREDHPSDPQEGAEDVAPRKSDGHEPMDGKGTDMYDDEEADPTSPGLRRMMAGDAVATPGDRACNVIAVFLLFAILITSIISIAAGACCLASLSGKTFKHFPMFFAFGVTPVVIGCICFVLAIVVLIFISVCAMGLANYGMCCYGTTRCRGALRVCLLGVFPFIVFLVLLAMCILGFTFYSLSQQLPPFDKDYREINGLSGPIVIVRDTNGLTHVKASSRRDAYVGQGFAEAQDRLFQLEFHRLVGKGELSTTVGNDGVSTDTSIRTMNLRAAAYAMCKLSSATDIDYFQAFADGVNLYLKHVSKRPVEFFFMSTRPLYFHNPEPFGAVDVCLTARLFQWQMSSNIDKEGSRFSIWAGTNRTYAEASEVYPDFTNQPNTIMTQAQMLTLVESLWNTSGTAMTADEIEAAKTSFIKTNVQTEAFNMAAEGATYDNILSMIRTQLQASAASSVRSEESTEATVSSRNIASIKHNEIGFNPMSQYFRGTTDSSAFAYRFIEASNAWAVRDAEGNAMAASDPHLTINQPSVWYYVHLSFPSDEGIAYDTAGVGLIGIPGVHIGKSTHVSWGITMSMTDLQDLFIFPPASLSGLPSGTYMYGGIQRVFVDRLERVKVKGKKDIVVNVQDSIIGPVVSDMLGFPSLLKVALFAVPLRQDDNESIGALMSLSDPSVDTAEKLMRGLQKLRAPGFSIPIADTTGNLAYVVTGQHPIRAIGHTGLFPTLALNGPDLLCRVLMAASGTVLQLTDTCDVQAVLTSAASSGASTSGVNMSALAPLISNYLQNANWTTYIPVGADEPFTSVPEELVPHLSIPYTDAAAANISCANQKIVPGGYPYFLGGDYSWPYRGSRIQQLLVEQEVNWSKQALHMDVQLNKRSNLWAVELSAIVENDNFTTGVADDALAAYWQTRLLAWDGMAVIGSVETAFFWRWLQRMSILPRDVLAAIGSKGWNPTSRYITRMLTEPSARMTAECADYIQNWTSTRPCWDFATAKFKEQANAAGEGYAEQWGKDLNRMHGLHEMLSTKIIHPVFQREITKGGDSSSVDVSHNAITGAMQSTQASSMRQLYDMWNSTHHIYFQLPAGNSGNPYSKFYDNLLYMYEREEYIYAESDRYSYDTVKVLHKQTLSQ